MKLIMIQLSTIRWGGIMFDVVINNDRELIVSSILSKDTQLKIGSWSPSIKLEALLGL